MLISIFNDEAFDSFSRRLDYILFISSQFHEVSGKFSSGERQIIFGKSVNANTLSENCCQGQLITLAKFPWNILKWHQFNQFDKAPRAFSIFSKFFTCHSTLDGFSLEALLCGKHFNVISLNRYCHRLLMVPTILIFLNWFFGNELQ